MAFTHYFGDTLVVQRELRSYLVNVYRGEEYAFSFFFAEGQSLQDLLRRFLTLADWDHLAGTTYQLDSWHPLLRTRSPRYMQKIATALADESLPFTVQTPVLNRDPRGQLTLLVPSRDPAAIAVLHKVEDHLSTLRDQATAAFAANDRDRELVIYAELATYGLNNPAIYYNLGSALAEAGRYAEACDRLCRSRIPEPYCARRPSPIPVPPGHRRARGDFRDGGDVDLVAQTGREDANR